MHNLRPKQVSNNRHARAADHLDVSHVTGLCQGGCDDRHHETLADVILGAPRHG